MSEDDSTGIAGIKRTNTAQLRMRFDSIYLLHADGFNHKQICEHLNSQGVEIPYPQYRAIMTRLRKEKATMSSSPRRPTQSPEMANHPVLLPGAHIKPMRSIEADVGAEKEKKLSWNPGSEVKWK